MTPEEREKLIKEIKWKIVDGVSRGFHYLYVAEQVLAIVDSVYAKKIEEAYKEGYKEGCSDNNGSPNYAIHEGEYSWIHSHARAAILASIPEKKL